MNKRLSEVREAVRVLKAVTNNIGKVTEGTTINKAHEVWAVDQLLEIVIQLSEDVRKDAESDPTAKQYMDKVANDVWKKALDKVAQHLSAADFASLSEVN
jgi:methyl coenzyme M reductase subunit C-like uncharacterized protein (methanogenesis marker protein 7)